MQYPWPTVTQNNGSFEEIMQSNSPGSWLERHAYLAVFLRFSPMVQGLCLPSACSGKELHSIVSNAAKRSRLPLKTSLTCEAKTKTYDATTKLSAILLALISLISITSTILIKLSKVSKAAIYLRSFDIIANSQAIMRESSNQESKRFQFVSGVRVTYLVSCIMFHLFMVCFVGTPSLYRKQRVDENDL